MRIATTAAPTAAALPGTASAVAAAFAVQGLLFISLTTRLPRFQDRWDLSELFVSGLLLMVVLLAGAGSALAEAGGDPQGQRHVAAGRLRPAGRRARRWSPWRHERGVFVGGLAVYGLGLGVVDAASNMQAVALEHRYGRTILPSFHGAWTAGGIVATVVAIAVTQPRSARRPAAARASSRWCCCAAPLLPASADPPVATTAAPALDVPWRQIMLLGAAMVLFYMVDTAATTWGPVFLKSAHEAPDWLLPLATLPYLVASLRHPAGRRRRGRAGRAPCRCCGSARSSRAAALAVIVFSPSWSVAVLGFTVAGRLGRRHRAAVVLGGRGRRGRRARPEARRARVDAVIARFNQFNYVGGLLGRGADRRGRVGVPAPRVRRADGPDPGDPAPGRRVPHRAGHAAYLTRPDPTRLAAPTVATSPHLLPPDLTRPPNRPSVTAGRNKSRHPDNAAAAHPRGVNGPCVTAVLPGSGAGLGEASGLGVGGGLEPELGVGLVVPLAVGLVELARVGVALDRVGLVGRGAVLVRGDRTGRELRGGSLGGLGLGASVDLGGLGRVASAFGRPRRPWSRQQPSWQSLAARLVAASASLTVAFLASGSRTSSITAMGALSPLRAPILVMRV